MTREQAEKEIRDTFTEAWADGIIKALKQEPRKGHWIDIHNYHNYNDGDIETTELRCSCCNETVEWDIELPHKPYYCENCGADMIGENKDAEHRQLATWLKELKELKQKDAQIGDAISRCKMQKLSQDEISSFEYEVLKIYGVME